MSVYKAFFLISCGIGSVSGFGFTTVFASGAAAIPTPSAVSPAPASTQTPVGAGQQGADAAQISPTRVIQLPMFAVFENVADFAVQKVHDKGKIGEEEKKLKGSQSLRPRESPFDHSRARYNVILALATWSDRAKELGRYFQTRLPELKTRRIAVVGVFTHDSFEDIALLAQKEGYKFSLARTDIKFVEKLLNPKIPTIWVTDHRGQVVYRLVRPTSEGMAKVYEYLLAWTDF